MSPEVGHDSVAQCEEPLSNTRRPVFCDMKFCTLNEVWVCKLISNSLAVGYVVVCFAATASHVEISDVVPSVVYSVVYAT